MRRLLAVCIITAARAADDTRAAEAEADPELATDRLQARVDSLRGDDARLVRYSATDHTAAAQSSGACEPFARALGDVVVAAAKSGTLGAEPDREVLALQVAALCVVDNPAHRAKLSSVAGVHEAVAALVSSRDKRVSAAASELVYIGAFANAKNHAGFIGAGAVAALGRVVLDEAASPVSAMWATAALQNLFASYCDTPDDGRCYWRFGADRASPTLTLWVDDRGGALISDGAAAREAALEVPGLAWRLAQLLCLPPDGVGPVAATTRASDHSLVRWAAAGALKNLALDLAAAEWIEPAMACACGLADSSDWLEANKARGLLARVRRDDPCRWDDEDMLCVDLDFLDAEGRSCVDYDDAGGAAEACATPDVLGHNTTPAEACCACGGGAHGGEAVDDDGGDDDYRPRVVVDVPSFDDDGDDDDGSALDAELALEKEPDPRLRGGGGEDLDDVREGL